LLAVIQWLRAFDKLDSLPALLNIVVFALLLVGWDDMIGVDRHRLRLSFAAGTLVACVFVLIHEYPLDGRMGAGLGLNPNYFGYLAGLALLFLAGGEGMDKRFGLLTFSCGLFLSFFVYLTDSRAAIYGAALCVGLIPVLQRNVTRALVWSVPAAGLAVIVSGVDPFDYTAFSYRLASPFIDTFAVSGSMRSAIWEFLVQLLKDHWLLGIGFANIPAYTETAGLTVYGTGVQSHNIYLTLSIEMGIAGALLFILWQLRMLAYGLAAGRRGALLVSVLLYLIVEGFLGGTNLTFLSGVAILLALPRSAQR
jgi:O-antigen ligase